MSCHSWTLNTNSDERTYTHYTLKSLLSHAGNAHVQLQIIGREVVGDGGNGGTFLGGEGTGGGSLGLGGGNGEGEGEGDGGGLLKLIGMVVSCCAIRSQVGQHV